MLRRIVSALKSNFISWQWWNIATREQKVCTIAITRRWPVQARVVTTEFLLFIYFRATYMLAFLCRLPLNPYFTELNTPFFCRFTYIYVIPVFIKIIATPQQHFFSWNAGPMSFWSRFPTFLEPQITPNPPSCMYLVAHNHACPFLYARLQTGRIMVWWCPSVRPSVRPGLRPSIRPSVRPSVTVFRTFLLHALRYWAEILCITLFSCT